MLKRASRRFQVIAVEPAESPVLIAAAKTGPHKIQGIGAGFIQRFLNTEAHRRGGHASKRRGAQYGAPAGPRGGPTVGISSGAAPGAALQSSAPENKGKLMVVIVALFGERYLSTPLFADAD